MTKGPEHYPRVLLINGASLRPETSMGITLTHLFSGWPRDRLAQVYGEAAPPDPEICPRCWQVSLKDVPMDCAVRGLFGRNLDRVFGAPAAGVPAATGTTSTLGGRPRSNKLRNICSAWADLLSYRLPSDFWTWIEEFRPQVIYSMLGGIRLMRLVLKTSQHFNLPIVPHIMDDWPTTHYRFSIFSRLPRAIMLFKIRTVFQRSPLGMTIGDAMAEEYQQRYGIRFEGFMNCVEIPSECPLPPERAEGEPLRFVFIGGLHYNRWQSLCDIGAALVQLSAKGMNAIVDVYAPQVDLQRYGPALREWNTLYLHESFRTEDLPAVLRNAEVLLHIDSFDEYSQRYFRLSLSTKVPLYLSTGRPILAYGPEDVNTCRYLKSCDCGLVIGSRDSAALQEALWQLGSRPDLRRQWGQRAWEQACARHDEKAVRERFRSLLAEAASMP